MSTILVNTLTGTSTAGSIVVTGEGNSTTTNLQQGLAKAWGHLAGGGASLPDSFNLSSIDDDGTGEYGLNYTSAMNSATYSATSTINFNHAANNNTRHLVIESKATGSVEVDGGYTAGSTAHFTAYDIETTGSVTVHGDLA